MRRLGVRGEPRRLCIDVVAGGPPIRYRLATFAASNPARRPFVSDVVSALGTDPGPGTVAESSLVGRDGVDASLALRGDELRAAAERRVATWVVARAALPDAEASAGSDPGVTVVADAPDAPDALALVTRRAPSSAGDGETVALIDGVPQARHWFAADGWAAAFRVTIAPACRDGTRACRWRADRSARRAAGANGHPDGAMPPIELTLSPGPRPPGPIR